MKRKYVLFRKNMKRKLSKVLYLQIFVLTFQVQETFLLCLVQAFEFSNFLPDHQKYKSKFNFEGRTQCRELPLCAGSGKGVSGKPYPRLYNARRPRLEPGTFRSQAVLIHALPQFKYFLKRNPGYTMLKYRYHQNYEISSYFNIIVHL